MSERDRYYRFALGGAVLVFTGAALFGWWRFDLYQSQHSYERQKAAEYQANQAAQEIAVCRFPSVCLDDAAGITPNPQTKTPDYATYYDLKAQQDMSEWTYALLWVGVLGLIATVIGIAFVYENLRETRRMTIATREIGEAQSRAYLTIVKIKFSGDGIGLDYVAGDLWILGTILVKNIGQTPAYGLQVTQNWDVWCFEDDISGGDSCEFTSGGVGVLAPGETCAIELEAQIRLPDDEKTKAADIDELIAADDWSSVTRVVDFKNLFIEVATQISFQDVFSKNRRQVAFSHMQNSDQRSQLAMYSSESSDTGNS